MASPFSSALAKLDGSLQAVHSQIDSLGAALEVNDDRLLHSLTDARRNAARLRDLVRAERPDARWESRTALGQLVHELEVEIAAKARRNQQRRDRLSEVANELEAGTVKHRFDTRKTALNALRTEAIRELRAEAALPENVKELAGPSAYEWLHWACSLLEPQDAAVLSDLRNKFPKLERFAGEMEESYWVPAPRPQQTSPQVAPASAVADDQAVVPSSAPAPADRAGEPEQQDSAVEYYITTNTANYDRTGSLRYNGSNGSAPVSEISAEGKPSQQKGQQPAAGKEVLLESIASAPHVKYCECGGTYPAGFHVCPFDGAPLRLIADPSMLAGSAYKDAGPAPSQAASGNAEQPGWPAVAVVPGKPVSALLATAESNDDDTPEAEAEFERLKALLQQNSGESGEFQLLDDHIPRKKLFITVGAAAALVVLCVGLIFAYRSSAMSVGKLSKSVVAAGARVAGSDQDPMGDADIQRDLAQKLAALKGSTIQASVEEGVVTLTGQSPSRWDALHAEALATQIGGVKIVKNEVEVQPEQQAATKGRSSKGRSKK